MIPNEIARVCPQCFQNSGLQKRLEQIRPDVGDGKCQFHSRRVGLPIEQVAKVVDEVFRDNYDFGDSEPVFGVDVEDTWVGARQLGEPFRDIVEQLCAPHEGDVLDALANQLVEDDFYWPGDGEEPFYVEDASYQRVQQTDGGHGQLWEQFCESVVYGQRFFGDEARSLLSQIFKDIHLQRDIGTNYPVYLLDPGKTEMKVVRARIASDADFKDIVGHPSKLMGPAPRRLGKPNRMNPSGIPAFYGAFDADTCIAELRPIIGVRVAVATFKVTRPVCILDTTRFEEPPRELNLFAKDHSRRLSQWRFMQSFMKEISKPISPTDEHLDYVPTQVVAEYLNKIHQVYMGRQKRNIDAIIYNSAQRPGGKNIVFLGAAANMEDTKTRKVQSFALGLPPVTEPTLDEAPALQYVPESLGAYEVGAATFESKELDRYYWDERYRESLPF